MYVSEIKTAYLILLNASKPGCQKARNDILLILRHSHLIEGLTLGKGFIIISFASVAILPQSLSSQHRREHLQWSLTHFEAIIVCYKPCLCAFDVVHSHKGWWQSTQHYIYPKNSKQICSLWLLFYWCYCLIKINNA